MKKYQTFEPCIACGKVEYNGNALHHIYTQKAYPQYKDCKWNLMPLCFFDHVQIHQKGLSYMVKIRSIKNWLLENNWHQDSYSGKWINSQD